MSNELLYFMIVMVQNLIIVIYADLVINYKYNRKITNIGLYIFLTTVFLITTPIINIKPLKLLIITIANAIFFKLISNDSWKESIKKSVISDVIMLLGEIIASSIYMLISNLHGTRLDIDTASTFDTLRILAGVYVIPILMWITLVYAIFYHKIKGLIRRKLIFLLTLIPFSLTFVHYIIYSYNIETFTETTLWFIFATSILFSIMSISIYKLIIHIQSYVTKEKELEFLKQKEKLELEYYKIMQTKEEELRKINHDIKNNLQIIYTLETKEEKEKLINKINDNLKKYELIKYSKQNILNIVLNTKVNLAKINNIKIEVSLKHNLEFLEELDVSNLISNILDNAIDNSLKASSKEINFSINKKMNYIVIKCSNTYDGKIKLDKDNKLKSIKKGNHGYGLKIISEVVKKYNGEMDIKYDDSLFKVLIMIPIVKR